MTVTVIYQPTVLDYTGLGDYAFLWDIVGAEALEVYAVNTDNNNERTLIPPTDYTVVFDGTTPIYDSGTITLTVEAPAGTTLLSIERNTPITQLVDLQEYGRFPANVVEFALDKLTMICQEIAASKCNLDP